MSNVLFKYGIRSTVVIDAIDKPARVIALMLDHEGPSYRVCYWHDERRYTDWLFAWELREAITPTPTIERVK